MNNENAIPEPIKHVSEKQIRAGRGQLIQRLTAALVGLLAGAFFLFLGIPLVALLVREPPATLWAALQQPDAFSALQLSVVTTTISTILTVLFGLPVAYVLARTRVPGRAFLETLVTMPTVLPPVVAGVALLIAFGRVGLIGRYLAPFGIELPFTTVAVVMAQMFVSAPFFVNTTRAGLEQLDRRYEQAAYTLRASPFYTFRRVVLPLIRPALLSGAGLAWARALGELGATITFAGSFPGITETMPIAVYTAAEADIETAVALSVVLMAVSFAILLGLRLGSRRSGFSVKS
ncbi:MAG TPA: ABC transporter permease [Ktedonobacteraceae bacterium]|jgi:molybdate transport system permease protein|nr:ABC transporter permease [Ktedonobacteraceae bacterium]